MTTETTTRRPIRSYGHARALLVALEHVPSLFCDHNGRVGSHCGVCDRWAYIAPGGREMEGEALERCPGREWEEQ